MEYSYLHSISPASNRIRYLLLQGVAHDTRRVWAFLDHAITILLDVGLACFNVLFDGFFEKLFDIVRMWPARHKKTGF